MRSQRRAIAQPSKRWLSVLTFGPCLFLLTCHPAFAHTAFKSMGGFWSGVLHLFTSLDQIGLLTAFGIWSRLQTKPRHALTLAGIFIGILLGTLVPDTAVTWLRPAQFLPVMMVVAGIAGALRLQLGSPVLAGIAAIGGCLAGMESADGATQLSLPLFALGSSIAGASLLSYLVIGTARLHSGWSKIALRAGASWIAAIGAMMAAFGLRALSAS